MIIFFYPYEYGIQNGANRRIEFLSLLLKTQNIDCEVFDNKKIISSLTPFQKFFYFLGMRRFIFFYLIYKILKKKDVRVISEVIFAPTWLNNFYLQVHDLKAFNLSLSRGTFLRKYLYLLFMKLAAHIIVGSEFMKQEIFNICNIPLKKITVILNGISNNRLNLANSFKRQNLTYDFLYLSGFAKHKNHSLLINSLPLGSKTCLIGQDIGTLDDVKKLILKREGEIHVDVFSEVSNDIKLFSLIASSRYCVFTSSYEGFGIPILEYAALDKYILASRISAFIEMDDLIDEFFDLSDKSTLRSILDKLFAKDYYKVNGDSSMLYHNRYSERKISNRLKNLLIDSKII
jgi:glycosyltransferase involved in cell wall biosynthesis